MARGAIQTVGSPDGIEMGQSEIDILLVPEKRHDMGLSRSLVYVGIRCDGGYLDVNLGLDFLFTGFCSDWKYRQGWIDIRGTIEHVLNLLYC